MNAENLARARDWIERAIDAMSDSEESVVRACAAALAAAVQAKGEHIGLLLQAQGSTHQWIVNSILAHAADVPEVPS